jgi:hypothetical protein
MPKKPPLMRLSHDEERFLRHWIYDEAHYQDGAGPAKRLQIQHRAIPADLAVLIAATIPDPIDQEKLGLGPPPFDPPTWPWTEDSWKRRVSEAELALANARSSCASTRIQP